MPDLDLTVSQMVAEADREAIRRRILEGEGSMPPFEDKLSRGEVEVLVAYTLELAGPGAER